MGWFRKLYRGDVVALLVCVSTAMVSLCVMAFLARSGGATGFWFWFMLALGSVMLAAAAVGSKLLHGASGPVAQALGCAFLPGLLVWLLVERLVGPRWRSSGSRRAVDGVSCVEDQRILRRIVSDRSLAPAARSAASSRLTDSDLLHEVAEEVLTDTGLHPTARAKAAALVTDQTLLVRIGCEDSEEVVRKAALAHIPDQRVLLELANGARLQQVRKLAEGVLIARARSPLCNRDDLLGYLSRDNPRTVREAAVERLEDRGLLQNIARTDPDDSVRAAAIERLIERLEDQGEIVRLVSGELPVLSRDRLQDMALCKVTDARWLFELFMRVRGRYRSQVAARLLNAQGGPVRGLETAMQSLAGATPALEAFVDALTTGCRLTRQVAALALKAIGWSPDSGTGESATEYYVAHGDFGRCVGLGRTAIKPLLRELDEGPVVAAPRVARALTSIADPAAMPGLAGIAEQRGDERGARAAAALEAFGGDAVPHFIGMLSQGGFAEERAIRHLTSLMDPAIPR